MKKYLTILLLSLVCVSCHAHRPHRHHPHRHRPVVVVTPPSTPVNKLSSRDRMNMALAYLNKNKKMSISTYSKMTGLSKATAEAELDAFSLDKNIPIGFVVNGKKKVYVLTT